jgi:hypothetical protein
MTGTKISRPGERDDQYMLVTCTPDEVGVEFFEFQGDALDAARDNLHPTTTTYLGQLTHQGEHRTRGTSKHIALLVDIDPELHNALALIGNGRSRDALAKTLRTMMQQNLDQIREQYRSTQRPPRTNWWRGTSCSSRNSSEARCHPGDRCDNHPACESCGPARL